MFPVQRQLFTLVLFVLAYSLRFKTDFLHNQRQALKFIPQFFEFLPHFFDVQFVLLRLLCECK